AAMNRNPQIKPMIGERTMKSATVPTVFHRIAAKPAAEIPAPTSPPIRAWEDDVGRPKNQVMMFHAIAPTSAPSTIYGTTARETTLSSTIVLMVFATATPNPKAAAKLKKAANTTAFLGERTFVETTVDMELAESWNPFVKSNTSAMPMMAAMSSHVASIMQCPHESCFRGHECLIAMSESTFATSSQ